MVDFRFLLYFCFLLYVDASIVTVSPFLFPEYELVTEPEEEEEEKKEVEDKGADGAQMSFASPSLSESKL